MWSDGTLQPSVPRRVLACPFDCFCSVGYSTVGAPPSAASVGSALVPRQSEGPRSVPSGRVFAAQVEEPAAVDVVVAGIVLINGIRSRALFDTGASHSFICQSVTSIHGIEVQVNEDT